MAALVALLLAFAACGEDESASQAPAERAFLQSMVPHHRSATEMARVAEARAELPEVRRIAAAIGRDQPREIEQMGRIHQRLLGEPLREDMMAHEELGLSAGEAGMDHMDGAQMIAGADPFDRAFLEEMIPHHEGATRMAEAVLQRTEDTELRGLAQEIIGAQRSEIDQMRRILVREYGR